MAEKNTTERTAWNKHVIQKAFADGGFLQSYEWGEVQKAYGRNVWRLDGVQIIQMPLRFGFSYLYVPRPGETSIQAKVLENVKKIAKQQRGVFIRIDGVKNLQKFGFRKANISIQPQEEMAIDVVESEEQLLKNMKPKTRYNIKIAQKHGIEIKQCSFEAFWQLVQKTSKRQNIRPHPKAYYKAILDVLQKYGMVHLYSAIYKKNAVAAAMVVYFGKTAIYLHGGSDDTYKNTMAPYLLHWQILRDAKKAGLQAYNLGGVSKDKKSWEGITRFKTGFSPSTEFSDYGLVWDFPMKKFLYFLYSLKR